MLGSKPAAAAAAKPVVGALNGAFGAMSLGAAPHTPVKPAVVANAASPTASPGGSPSGSPQNGSPNASRSATPPQADQKGAGQQQAAKPAAAAPANANDADDAEEELSLHNVDLGSLTAVNKCIREMEETIDGAGLTSQKAALLKQFVNSPNDNNATPLHMVAIKCSTILANPDVMKVTMRLLDLGSNVNAQSKQLHTPMHTAIASYCRFMLTKPEHFQHTVHSQFNVLRAFCGLMISRGADCTLKDIDGKTALQGLVEVMPNSLKATVKIDRDSLLAFYKEGVAAALAARNAQAAAATVTH